MLIPEMSHNHYLTKFVLNREVYDDILSAFALQLPRCIAYLHYFCCIANRLICCSLCDMKEVARGKRETRGQSTRR